MTGWTSPDNFPFPNDYNAPADVPAGIEALAQAVQAEITDMKFEYQLIAPIGTIVMWPQASAPAGWHLCNGTAHGSTALGTVLGSGNTPDFRDRFIVAAGSGYAVGATGGAATVAITGGQSGLRDHAHTAWTAGASVDHAHHTSMGGGDHAHGTSPNVYGAYNGANQDADVSFRSSPNRYASWTNVGVGSSGHSHAAWSGGQSADHTHGVGMNGSGWQDATEAHENRPPYYALTYIIRKA